LDGPIVPNPLHAAVGVQGEAAALFDALQCLRLQPIPLNPELRSLLGTVEHVLYGQLPPPARWVRIAAAHLVEEAP
jgi:hypothetical protein